MHLKAVNSSKFAHVCLMSFLPLVPPHDLGIIIIHGFEAKTTSRRG
jgi:hypothetical protein